MTMTTGVEDEEALDRAIDALCFALQVLDRQGLAKPALHISLAIDLLQAAAVDPVLPKS